MASAEAELMQKVEKVASRGYVRNNLIVLTGGAIGADDVAASAPADRPGGQLRWPAGPPLRPPSPSPRWPHGTRPKRGRHQDGADPRSADQRLRGENSRMREGNLVATHVFEYDTCGATGLWPTTTKSRMSRSAGRARLARHSRQPPPVY